jgi:hypothetical protein
VDCKLSGATETTCFPTTVIAEQSSYTPGPWCSINISDGPDKSGICLEGGEAFAVDGAIFQNTLTFYDDYNWQVYNQITGGINVTDSHERCLAAACPDVEPAHDNHSFVLSGFAFAYYAFTSVWYFMAAIVSCYLLNEMRTVSRRYQCVVLRLAWVRTPLAANAWQELK